MPSWSPGVPSAVNCGRPEQKRVTVMTDLPVPSGPGPVREQPARGLPPYSGPGGGCPKCGQPGARTRWHWGGGALAPLEPDGSAPACAGPGIVDEVVTGEHLCRSCPVCGYGWPESCTVAGARAVAALALPPGCGPALVSLASGLLPGGAGFLLSQFLGGAALAGTWLAATLTVAAAAGLVAGAVAAGPGRRGGG